MEWYWLGVECMGPPTKVERQVEDNTLGTDDRTADRFLVTAGEWQAKVGGWQFLAGVEGDSLRVDNTTVGEVVDVVHVEDCRIADEFPTPLVFTIDEAVWNACQKKSTVLKQSY